MQIEHVNPDCTCPGKTCNRCKLTLCYGKFHRNRYAKTGIQNPCVDCKRKRQKERTSSPKAKEKARAYSMKYRHRPEVQERLSVQQKKRRAHPKRREKILVSARIYRKRPEVQSRERARKKSAKYQEWRSQTEVQEKERERQRNLQKYPETRFKKSIRQSLRRARQRSVKGTYTAQDIQEQLKRQGYRCYYLGCGQAKFEKDTQNLYGYRFHVDHLIPLSRTDATPSNDISNIVLACPACNLKKHDKLPHEFYEGGRLF